MPKRISSGFFLSLRKIVRTTIVEDLKIPQADLETKSEFLEARLSVPAVLCIRFRMMLEIWDQQAYTLFCSTILRWGLEPMGAPE